MENVSVGTLDAILERLQHSANVRTVYAEPIERDDRTVVPVARVAYGFGGGFGRGGGGGGGGGASATPIGALEIDDDGTRFVRFGERKQTVTLLLAGLVLGLLVGRWTGRD